MATISLFSLAAFLSIATAQQVGTLTPEVHPAITWQKCTVAGGCTNQNGAITIDANWRWLHSTSGSTNCYSGNTWDSTLCPSNDAATCTANCALEGASYASTYGITTSGNSVTLKFVTNGGQKNVGSRIYLMNTDTTYQVFNALNMEFTMDVDTSNLPCGLNGAVYFVEMDADGGMSKYPTNKAGAKYGTGYCDSQCPRDLKFIAGQANNVGWTSTTSTSGNGNYGACCPEMDIWEANSISAAYTPHPCSVQGLYKCTGQDCATPNRYGGVCDPDGCDFNSYRMGAKSFYGPAKTVNTNTKFTIVTQFITDTGTSSGKLVEIRRVYVQNGVVINNSQVNVSGMAAYDSITTDFCSSQKTVFGDTDTFSAKGGLAAMGQSLARGGVLVLSVWDDYAAQMLWLDSNYPTTGNPATPGVARGTCATTSGAPADVEAQSPNASVTYSNIRFGELGSTVPGVSAPGHSSSTTTTSTTTTSQSSTNSSTSKTSSSSASSSTTSKASSTSSASGATQTHYGQCGGTGYTGPTVCASPYTCKVTNQYYSQCL